MADCKLRIEIDKPSSPRRAGEPVSGTVIVTSGGDINCKALEVTSYWSTHGRGNVARGDVELATLFQGIWQAGQEYRYAFKLASAAWPPTYYGNYLNVGHFVEARARIAWKSDPRAQSEYLVVASDSPDDLAPTSNVVRRTPVWLTGLGWSIGLLLLGVFLIFLGPLMLIVGPILLIVSGVIWLVRVYLPSLVTGSIQVNLQPTSVAPGAVIEGQCIFTPKRTSVINGVYWTVSCTEECASGSGSSRQTHRNELISQRHELSGPTTVKAGQTQRFTLSYKLPENAAPSLKLTDNEIQWTSELRIDIPKWPDFAKKLPFIVKATDKHSPSTRGTVFEKPEMTVPEDDDDTWLTEVLQQIYQSSDDPERLKVVIQAVAQQTFELRVDLEELLQAPDDFDFQEDGYWVAALDTARDVDFALHCPQSMKFEQNIETQHRQLTATLLGWDPAEERVIARVLESK